MTRNVVNLDKLTVEDSPVISDHLVSSPIGEKVAIDKVLSLVPQVVIFRDALDTVTAVPHLLTGVYEEIGNTVSADMTTDVALAGQHLYIDVQTITTGGDMVVTGAKVDEATGVVTDDFEETLVIGDDNAVLYQTDTKWLEITNIDVETGDIDTIDFDYGILGYLDMGNKDWKITGFRFEAEADGASPDIQLRIRKIQDEGAGVFTVVSMEAIGFDASAANGVIDDNKRTAGDDRSFTLGATLLASGQLACIKCTDYDTFYTSDENILESASKAEGVIIDFIGSPSGDITKIAHITLTLFFEYIM